MLKTFVAGLALTLSTAAFAADSPAPKPECECCKTDKPMACCDKHKNSEKKDEGHSGHEGHDMDGMHHD